ncbi:DUF7675 family protein [Trueperella bialowiezensis]|uniref:DUF7675 domain-containing protein n=1 Tax=Trueperella bialowiezensis TaxID=312285 RepID=A0A3S4X5R8_9ACTO|nr:hypothetical protein [Trueperella bialowiezensis]VEI13259.1 Uncharacterised protein [Trueperella bialowiezensis]
MKSNQFIAEEDNILGARIWDVTEIDEDGNSPRGVHLVTFDKKTVLNLFADYPHNFSAEQIEIVKKERPFWADFFKGRSGA